MIFFAAVVDDVMQMTDYYTHMVCTPARASLMTGRYVVRFGMQYNIVDTGAPWGLPLTEKVGLGTGGGGAGENREGRPGRLAFEDALDGFDWSAAWAVVAK